MNRSVVVLAVLLAVLTCTPTAAQYCEEEVVFATSPGTLSMYHSEALFNCCAWLDIEAVTGPGNVEITEWEMFEFGPCYCLCCFDASATVAGLEPGEYAVKVWKALDNFDGTWEFVLAADDTLLIEGESAPYLETSYVPCVESGAADEPQRSTWGTIKSLYR